MQPIRLVLTAFTVSLASTLSLVVACGSSSSGNPAAGQDSGQGGDTSMGDTSVADTGTANEAAVDGGTDGPVNHLAFPKVIDWGDPQMTAAKVVTITFQGDPMASQLAAFGEGVTQSSWWSTVIADYCPADAGGCMGQPGVAAPLGVPAAASYTDSSFGGASTLQPALQALIAAGSVPEPDANTLYLFYLPSTTTVNLDGSPGCSTGWDGYHGQTQYTSDAGAATTAIYGVVMECPMYQLSDVTNTATHEIAEAASDGYAGSSGNGGWYLALKDVNTFGWNDSLGGGEVGDLCVDQLGLGQDVASETSGDAGTFTAQRIWSTSQAALMKNPCIPVPSGEVYFSVSPEKAFFVMDVGQTRTFKATAFTDGTFPSWTLTPQDWTDPNTTYLQLSVSGSADGGVSVSDGSIVTITMKLLADPTGTYNGEADGVLMSTDTSDPNAATKGHIWPFAVMTTGAAADGGYMESAHRPPHRGNRVRMGRR